MTQRQFYVYALAVLGVSVWFLLLWSNRHAVPFADQQPAVVAKVDETHEERTQSLAGEVESALVVEQEFQAEINRQARGEWGSEIKRNVPGYGRSVPLTDWLYPDSLEDALREVSVDGLHARTCEWWSQPDFLALTGDELAERLPDAVASGYSFGGAGTLLDFIGALPTREDCELAYSDERVRLGLERVVELELPINSLSLTPIESRTAEWQLGFDALVQMKRDRELDLARELERATAYPHWSIVTRLFGAWMQQ